MIRNIPLIGTIGYLAFVFVLTILGPVHYFGFDTLRVGGYLSLISLAIFIGFKFGLKAQPALARFWDPQPERFPRKLLYGALGLSFLGFLITLYFFATTPGANLDISNLGETYNKSYVGYEMNSGNYSASFILYSILASPTYIATTLGLFFFREMKTSARIIFVIAIFGVPALFTIGSGTQKQVGDLMVALVSVFFVRGAIRGRFLSPRTVLAVSIVAVAGLWLFASILGQRYASLGINAFNINSREIALVQYDVGHPVFRIFGPETGFALAIISTYLTNGYAGLNYALVQPATWSFFFGSSYTMSVIGQRVFGLPFAHEYTYPYQTAFASGFGSNRWYSAFSWWASDFTWVGTIPLFAFFAYIYARVWRECIEFRNPYALLVFCQLTLGVIMLPANNQLLQTPGGFATLGSVIVLWLVFRRRYNRPLAPA